MRAVSRFVFFLRAPFALLDAGRAFLLLLSLGASPWRSVAAAGYWLSPLAIILSSYHGNTDCAVAFFLLLALWFISKEKLIPAAIVVGASLWIKLPGVVAIPALIFFIPKWKHRFVFLAVVGVVALVTYLPALIQDAPVVYKNVFGYRCKISILSPELRRGARAFCCSRSLRRPQDGHRRRTLRFFFIWKTAGKSPSRLSSF